jgi:hypothetical protein
MAGEVVYAKIMGSGEFPLDMLRYDSCSPATEEDSGIIRGTFGIERWGNWCVLVKKVLRVKRNKSEKVFTYGRWNSFGCAIQETDNAYSDRGVPEVRLTGLELCRQFSN